MKRYVFNKSLIFTGRVLTVTEFDPFPTFSTDISPPPLQAGEWAKWLGDSWEVITELPAVPERVPSEVTKRQARQQLITLGILDSVQTAIDAIADATEKALIQSFWDDSSTYERNHPQMLALSSAIGLDSDALDAAFVAAGKL